MAGMACARTKAPLWERLSARVVGAGREALEVRRCCPDQFRATLESDPAQHQGQPVRQSKPGAGTGKVG